jgi:hypothetical protein
VAPVLLLQLGGAGGGVKCSSLSGTSFGGNLQQIVVSITIMSYISGVDLQSGESVVDTKARW